LDTRNKRVRQYLSKTNGFLYIWCTTMSSNTADVNLSSSVGKGAQPVQRTSARVRKRNSSLDHKGTSLKRIRELILGKYGIQVASN